MARFILGGLLAALLLAQASAAQTVQLTCNLGPVERAFGGTPWVVYGCDDGKSLVVATAAENPASPFMFVIAWEPRGYRVSGEGQGDQNASSAAFEELRTLSRDQITALYASTQTLPQ
jgi:hypothetical protein